MYIDIFLIIYEFSYKNFFIYYQAHANEKLKLETRFDEKFLQIKSVIQEVKSNCRLDSWEIDYVVFLHRF